MKRLNIAQYRLQTQGIATADFTKPDEVVRHLLAMQSQDYNAALWAIGLRTKNAGKKDVEQAIKDRKIVRTWPMRGTLHFVHADDVHWLVELLAPRATASAKNRRIKQLGLTDGVVAEAEKVLQGTLKGGKSIARNQVVELLSRKVKGIGITNQHTQHLMRNFGERGIICFGPHDGKQPTFVLLDEWVPRPKTKSREDALKELALRYFTSHGPATLKDFAGWGYMTMTDAKKALELALPELDELVVSNTTHYLAPNLGPANSSQAYLLPAFDEYLLGYKDRSSVLATEHANKIVPGGNGMFLPTMLQNGLVTGVWRRKGTGKSVRIDFEPFTTPTVDSAKTFTTASSQYLDFLTH